MRQANAREGTEPAARSSACRQRRFAAYKEVPHGRAPASLLTHGRALPVAWSLSFGCSSRDVPGISDARFRTPTPRSDGGCRCSRDRPLRRLTVSRETSTNRCRAGDVSTNPAVVAHPSSRACRHALRSGARKRSLFGSRPRASRCSSPAFCSISCCKMAGRLAITFVVGSVAAQWLAIASVRCSAPKSMASLASFSGNVREGNG